jgi:predicted methyltransferase
VLRPYAVVFATLLLTGICSGPLLAQREALRPHVRSGNEYQRLRDRVSEGTASDPRLPPVAVDAIVVVNAYHEVTDSAAVLGAFRAALKEGGRLVLCEPRPRSPGMSRAEQVKAHVLSPELIAQELTAAGFEVSSREDDFRANPSGGQNAPYSLIVVTKR